MPVARRHRARDLKWRAFLVEYRQRANLTKDDRVLPLRFEFAKSLLATWSGADADEFWAVVREW